MCMGPHDERQPVQGTELVWADVAQQQTVRRPFWAQLPTNLIREKLLVTGTVCILVGYLYGKPRSFMYEGISQLSSLECFWSPSLLPSKEASWLLQWHQSVEILIPKDACWLFYNKLPRKGVCARLPPAGVCSCGLACAPHPQLLLLWITVNSGAVYIMVGLTHSPAERDEKRALLFVCSSAIKKSCISCLIS